MNTAIIRILTIALALLPVAASADPIELKFSFFTSDRSNIYQNTVKPFVDAVNSEGQGLIHIQMYFSGAISRSQELQPQLVASGAADLAVIVPGQSPERFGDTAVMELPGIYSDSREASLVFTHLIDAGALNGYGEFFVVGAFVSAAESIHSRQYIGSIGDLAGLAIRTNNKIESDALAKLGAIPVLMPINQTTDAISRDKIDGATAPPSMLFEFGIGRVVTNHYMLQLGGAPTALVMNRGKFDSLPPQAQAIIRKYGGRWLAERSAAAMVAADKDTLEQLKSDPRRSIVYPSPADLEVARKAYAAVVAEWAALMPHNSELLSLAAAEIKKLRASN